MEELDLQERLAATRAEIVKLAEEEDALMSAGKDEKALETQLQRLRVESELQRLMKEENREAEDRQKKAKDEQEKKEKAREQLRDIAAGKSISIGFDADRLQKIGGFSQGMPNVQARFAERQIQIQTGIKDAIEKLPKELAKELQGEFGLA
jgi:hypothetical protein